ncbi:peptide-methionine (S)-S-oxide reductase MsrA [Sporosarcina trichiuri]|uniref:peptide-methionine (S)-S-oxide reductase MsrA n=1 Tax=Sporosarcina trichiuri TaxID=3056445 RepID=UPI0025B2D661|nr:peptide-methionine (S)-S-oxide reductase MsrA [Sporosarcina sp. 0.2-SM1T-5]WJY27617.1 peptide-methionine (S)-S-oxide reductase MsrA [Sporosarcina sp. 0.2-SM1T-5]
MEKGQTIVGIEEGLHGQQEETALFGMGCYWGPDSRFGSLPGVLRTRVGFAGGTTEQPVYRNMGDHTETVEIVFRPSVISYEDLLHVFWENHYPNRDEYKGRQYISLIRYFSEEQKETIGRVKQEMEDRLGEPIETDIAPFASFTPAEEPHQKYYLKRYPKALEQLSALYPEESLLTPSAYAARLNGLVKSFGSKEELTIEIRTWPIPAADQTKLIDQLHSMKW